MSASNSNDQDTDHNEPPAPPAPATRPPIDYRSLRAFSSSVKQRAASIWTRRFVLSLLVGQAVSLCVTCTNVATAALVARGWAVPTTQTFFLYFALCGVYTPYTVYRYGIRGWAQMAVRDGWKYFILAACDVQGNFLAVNAYQYTDLLSCMLLEAWAIPVCLFFSYIYMRTRYHWAQILGVLVCMGGLGMLVGSDLLTAKNNRAVDKGKGDAFMIAAATLYGFSNATEEFFVRRSPLYEVVGQLGMWGLLISGIQAAGLEHRLMAAAPWDGATIGILIAYTAAMFVLYSVAPVLYRMASSAYCNLSLLSSKFYGLLFGLFLYHYSPFWLYFPAFSVVLLGLFVYFWSTTPEEQGGLDPQAPAYVMRKPRMSSAAVPNIESV